MYWILKNKNSPCRIAKNSQGKPSETSVKSVFAKNKIISQGKKWKALLVVLFLVFSIGIFFADFNNAQAAENQGSCERSGGTWPAGGSKCVCPSGKVTNSTGDCADASVINGSAGAYTSEYMPSIDPKTGSVAQGSMPAKGSTAENDAYRNAYGVSCGTDGTILCTFKELLIGIFNLCGWLFAIAATLFAWVIDPSSVSGANGVLNKQAVKDVWIMVRDLLNMTFILILLFAAFCTIFQVSKWNLKKVWLNILINALLVNFSFPIARFFIDVSNVAFYYLVNNMFSSTGTVTGNTIFAGLNASAKLGPLLAPGPYSDYSVAFLVAMIIVVFLMGMTMMVIAALFVVRIVALAMLVMFSPVGFVGYIFPSTGGYADDWWKNLFSYSFFAPIMIFFMAVALRLTEALGRENFQTFISNANTNSDPNMAEWIASAAFYSIPVITMWIGIGVASSMKIKFANEVVKKVKEGGSWIANAPGHYSGVYGGTKKGWESMRKSGSFLGMNNFATRLAFKSGVADREAKIAGILSDGPSGWAKTAAKKKQDENKKKIEEGARSHLDGGASADSLAIDMNTHFGNPLPTDSKIKLEQAQLAAAYLKQDADERKAHIQNTLNNPGGLAGSDLANIINAAPAAGLTGSKLAAYVAHQNAARAAAGNIHAAHIAGGAVNMADVNQVASFANKQMKSRIEIGSKA